MTNFLKWQTNRPPDSWSDYTRITKWTIRKTLRYKSEVKKIRARSLWPTVLSEGYLERSLITLYSLLVLENDSRYSLLLLSCSASHSWSSLLKSPSGCFCTPARENRSICFGAGLTWEDYSWRNLTDPPGCLLGFSHSIAVTSLSLGP